MEKVVNIDGRQVGFKATALTPRLYRHLIGRDLMQDLSALQKNYKKAAAGLKLKPPAPDAGPAEKAAYQEAKNEAQLQVADLEIFENAAYIMARQYDPTIKMTPDEWLDTFKTFSVYEVLPAILELWGSNLKTTAKPKKKYGRR